MLTAEELRAQPLRVSPEDDFFPSRPFERIAIALSGGGFRATTYCLGVLSQLQSIRLPDEKDDGTTLLEKVIYGSSTSGGTITLSVYAACAHKGMSFDAFYAHLNQQLKGEELVHEAIRLLKDDQQWAQVPKSRNVINAFSKVYHDRLFGILGPDAERTMSALVRTRAHLQEVCFNATDFFTGIPFKFQVGRGWDIDRGGRIGNNNIRIRTDNPDAIKTLEQLRLSDVLACSSCFPTGFEPMVYPQDFTYVGGPSTDQLKQAFEMRTYSTERNADPDPRSRRAEKEKFFAEKGEFSIMDGGIVDNQGLDALKEANDRKADQPDASGNRFDLAIVCDVASFYMDPYNNPKLNTSRPWMRKTLMDYWRTFRKYVSKARSLSNTILGGAVAIAVLFLLPLILIEQDVAEIALAITGIALLLTVIVIRNKTRPLIGRDSIAAKLADYGSLMELARDKLPEEKSFQNRVLGKMAGYVQDLPTGVILQMIMARVQSSQVMIGEIFLKHVRRLIFDHFYDIPKLRYRRLNNVIYKLTFTNDAHRSRPRFEDVEDDAGQTVNRKATFLAEWEAARRLTDEMKSVAELAYNTGTTLWFENSQETEDPFGNNRRALLATGQFTTCYNLLGYTLSLKHSRHFEQLEPKYKKRVLSILEQLKEQMERFSADPFWMEKEYSQLKK